jgi:DNA polymerase (family X)
MPVRVKLDNETLAGLLRELAVLVDLAGEGAFKRRAYERAAESVDTWEVPVSDLSDLRVIPGIGTGIASKLLQMIMTGSCDKLDALRSEWGAARDLLKIRGVGPATARQLFGLGARTEEDVRELVKTGRFCPSQLTKEALGLVKAEERLPWVKAKEIADEVVSRLRQRGVAGWVEVCGSLRRGKETVGDLDIVVLVQTNRERQACEHALDTVVLSGEKKVSGTVRGFQVDFRFATAENIGTMTLRATGPKSFNIRLSGIAKKRGWKLSEYGLFDAQGQLVAGATERDVFTSLGLRYLSPEERA